MLPPLVIESPPATEIADAVTVDATIYGGGIAVGGIHRQTAAAQRHRRAIGRLKRVLRGRIEHVDAVGRNRADQSGRGLGRDGGSGRPPDKSDQARFQGSLHRDGERRDADGRRE